MKAITEINWKQKLTSRKFWAAIIGFITAILAAFNVSDITIEQVVTIISATSVLIAYIIGEGLVDASRMKYESNVIEIDLIDDLYHEDLADELKRMAINEDH